MRFKISIDCDNEAFGGAPADEVARILRELVTKLDAENVYRGDSWKLRDLNGNKVGKAEFA